MLVDIHNDGPVTLLLESKNKQRSKYKKLSANG